MADQLLSTVSHHSSLPDTYVRPESQRPRLHEVVRDANIPTIDLGSPDVSRIIAQVGDACRSFGFFQVVNHGVPVELMLAMMAVASEFFGLPPEEKAKHYSDDPTKKMRLSTSFNIRKETVRNWRDYLRLHCYPLEEFVPGWPSNPASFKEVVSGYCREVRQLGLRLLGLISLSLGLEEDYMVKVLGEQEQHMAVNYYPKCPEPELTYGLQAHTDPNALTILLQDPKVAGLQVLKNGKWIAVNPQPDAYVINIGDQLQAEIMNDAIQAKSFAPICLFVPPKFVTVIWRLQMKSNDAILSPRFLWTSYHLALILSGKVEQKKLYCSIAPLSTAHDPKIDSISRELSFYF
ncbi:flavanone 3-dioxygenase 2-like isoform X1 [Musa acuminata AAA Group]|uniref:flavanone 3-dioxygenase 2-like isoform X1 n=1 Tax=Musa acuminata AAA Group TaxID=214697 RepID=UPI0031E0FD7F